MMDEKAIALSLEQSFPDGHVVVDGDGRHFEALVVDQSFEGKSKLARHRLVYQALGEAVGGVIHALSIKAISPEEWKQNQ